MMKPSATRRTVLAGAAPLAMAPLLPGAVRAEGKKYVFYHILWGMQDPIVQFHINAGKRYMADHPNVEIKYVGPENYDPAEHAKFLDTVINAHPDGIAMHISSADALMKSLQAAKSAGIPFVSVTSHPPGAEDNAKLAGLYVTWVGADESKIGGIMAKRVLQEGTPKRVAYLFHHLGHAGLEQRAKGFFDGLPDVPADKVVIGDEPQAAMDSIRAYITSHPDVSVLNGNAPANKWMVDVVNDLGRKDIKILTSDDAPTSLECILQGYCLASFTQQFPIQAPLAYEVLLQYQETKMGPTGPIITGPAVIDKSNAQAYKDQVMAVFGKDGYAKLSPFSSSDLDDRPRPRDGSFLS
jgi:simple sugar transport system substrate-binding protein